MGTADDALSEPFQVGFESTMNGFKFSSFQLLESLLTESAHKAALEEIFKRTMERWSRSTTSTDVPVLFKGSFVRFVDAMVEFTYKQINENADKFKKVKLKKLCAWSLHVAETPRFPSESFDDVKN